MATPRKTGAVMLTYAIDNNTIVYDATQEGGSEHARKHFWVSEEGDGTVKLADNNNTLVGELMDVYADNTCSVATTGEGLQGISGAANGVNRGNQLVGATGDAIRGQTGGYVKNAGTQVNGRGVTTTVPAAAKNTVVTINFP